MSILFENTYLLRIRFPALLHSGFVLAARYLRHARARQSFS